MNNTKQKDIQTIKDVIIPGKEYFLHEIQDLTGLEDSRFRKAIKSLCNLDYLIVGFCDITGLTVVKTL